MQFKQRLVYIALAILLLVVIFAFSKPFIFAEFPILAKIGSASVTIIIIAIFAMIFGSGFDFVEKIAVSMMSVGVLFIAFSGLIAVLIRGGTEALYLVPLTAFLTFVAIGMIIEFLKT